MSEKSKFFVSFSDRDGKLYLVSCYDDVSKACLLALDLHRASNQPHAVLVEAVDLVNEKDIILNINAL